VTASDPGVVIEPWRALAQVLSVCVYETGGAGGFCGLTVGCPVQCSGWDGVQRGLRDAVLLESVYDGLEALLCDLEGFFLGGTCDEALSLEVVKDIGEDATEARGAP
jgi:hypothetical protein